VSVDVLAAVGVGVTVGVTGVGVGVGVTEGVPILQLELLLVYVPTLLVQDKQSFLPPVQFPIPK